MPKYYALESYDGDALRRKGLTANDLSRHTKNKVGGQTIRDMMNKECPTVKEGTLATLARALYVDVDELKGEQ
jgi:Helix-turn-helix domain